MQRYKEAGQDTIILAGAEYGSGSSRDWAAKGPMLLVSELFIYDSKSGVLSSVSLTFVHRSMTSCCTVIIRV